MASNQGQQTLYDRVDVHKSCKSLETLLGVLSDYCEAAEAVVILQKKLAKALRESAGLKSTTGIAANALGASANIFEALSDIDAKFAKIADKEYEGISTEVRKWFKKLAKEEKAHDDRIAVANGKIKQAGQVYEKKSKKSARDASDEHARYITLISALGPEISQEKYNHTLFVTQRHTSTTFNVAACMSRIADAEWLRACEGVRRYAPTVGPLGEWRALCEGGWGGPMPPDLPDLDTTAQQQPQLQPPPQPQTVREHINGALDEDRPSPPMYRQAEAINLNSQEPTEAHPGMWSAYEKEREQSSPIPSPTQPQYPQTPTSAAPQKQNQSTPPSSFDNPIRPFLDPNTGSVRSLSAFPAPPTHFPLPPVNSQRQQQTSLGQSSHSSSASHVSIPTLSRPSDVRIPGGDESITGETTSTSPVSAPPSPQQKFNDKPDISNQSSGSASDSHDGLRRPTPVRSLTVPSLEESSGTVAERSSTSSNTSKPPNEREFGSGYKSPTRGIDSVKGKDVDRHDTATSSGSVVAAMRSRYSYDSGASSPPPRDIPRLPMSVTDLATRYQPSDGPSSPRIRASSPPIARPLPPLDFFSQARQAEASFRERSPPGAFRDASTTPTPTSMPQPNLQTHTAAHDDAVRRQQRLEELEIKEKEQKLRARELEIELKSRELERQRDFLMSSSTALGRNRDGYISEDRSLSGHGRDSDRQARDTSLSRSRDDVRNEIPRPPHANSLAPPSTRTLGSSSEENGNSDRSGQSLNQLHPPYCTCDTCKNSRYGGTTSRPGEKSKGGWMRRLSMPIVAGNAFLDAKRHGGTMKRGLMSLDGKKNASTTILAQEDGRLTTGGRRSYDASGISNRSVTNLGRR
ncbi:uncharacterized protein EV420DRAFT_55600 [Desarmillaria tabescens]|uniref:Uncharacterized protein n=1 Tax=Armillaria tabescens TaxID=1929756 RepID=A0AA39NPZ1_ARMTA|nr:uncharacterized protein EV420DRAFT_55600 [Desarmillaria tabescens]KAK0469668.1 hypothetical protein EV420DRAFT_55600 [Desarmillaria tabescens]